MLVGVAVSPPLMWGDVAVDSRLIVCLLIVFLVIFAVQLKKYCFCAILVALFT